MKMINRTCGTCTKCCEGWLKGEVDGKQFYKGIACHNCVIGGGCVVYEDRPEDPCKTFQCSWLVDDSVPEWMKPNISNVLVYEKILNGHKCVVLTPAGADVSLSTFSWFIVWATQRYQNVVWQNEHGSEFYLGTSDFCMSMDNQKNNGA